MWMMYDSPAERGSFACPAPAPELTSCPWRERVSGSTVLMGTVIVPAVSATPTIIGVAASATDPKAVLAVAMADEKTIPAANVNVAVETPPEHADEVADVPKPTTVAVPVPVHVNVTVVAFVPVAVKATFVTEMAPPASASETAGASWLFNAEPVM